MKKNGDMKKKEEEEKFKNKVKGKEKVFFKNIFLRKTC